MITQEAQDVCGHLRRPLADHHVAGACEESKFSAAAAAQDAVVDVSSEGMRHEGIVVSVQEEDRAAREAHGFQ